jgi:hypothetical protein
MVKMQVRVQDGNHPQPFLFQEINKLGRIIAWVNSQGLGTVHRQVTVGLKRTQGKSINLHVNSRFLSERSRKEACVFFASL